MSNIHNSHILNSHILDLAKQHCSNTNLEYSSLTNGYVLYHNDLNEYFQLDRKYLLEHNDYNLAFILVSFDLKGISGAKTAILDIKAKKTPLWKVLNGR